MNNVLNSWWAWALRGVFAIIFGILVIFFPGDALQALVYLFGAYALVDGGFTVYTALSERSTNWGWHLVEGIISIVAGLAAFFLPLLTGLTLLLVIAFWAVFTGIMQMVAAWRLREEIENEIWLGLAGLISIIFGVFVFFDPLGGALATAWIIGVYSIAFGILMILVAMRYRELTGDDVQTPIADGI